MAVSRSKTQPIEVESETSSSMPEVSAEERCSMIAESAYYRAEQRGFQNGDPVADWLAAEKEVDEKLAKQG